ncbi:MAG: hypothetical protein H5T98_00805 [Syntrophomonadaceae bacterium]|nr:hypothetical protein [Syntrophomonadaceae bacterium]
MNPLETTAMLDKITEAGGSFYIKDGELFGRDVPMQFHGFVKAEKATIIRILEAKLQVPKPVAKKRASLDYKLSSGKAGSVSGDDSDTAETLLETLLEKWPGEVVRAWNDDGVVYP